MYYVLLAILVVYVLALSIVDYFDIFKLKDKPFDTKERISFYKSTILWGWVPVVFIFAVLALTPISMADIGLKLLDMNLTGIYLWIGIASFIICGGLFIALIYQTIAYLVSNKARIQGKEQLLKMQSQGSHYDKIISQIIPKTKEEKWWFTAVSLTAGIGEEIVFRGYFFFLLMSIFPNMPLYFVPIIVGVFFGVAHYYQGVRGMIKTALLGIVLGSLYIVCDSLIPVIILHFIMDFSSNFLYEPEELEQAS